MTVIRSALFNLAFYVAGALMVILTLPGFALLPERQATGIVQAWARMSLFLLRIFAGLKVEIRGAQYIPQGGAIVASKHQSALETFALIPYLPYPTLVMKKEIRQIPLFGWYTTRTGMIHVDRDSGPSALRALVARAKTELAKGRQILIFPEGTRRPPGAPAEYRNGIALLYRALDVPVVPVALNSGLYWPRREFLRHPGTVVVEFLPPIPPKLDGKTFLARLETTIETASDALLAEADRARPRPPFPAEAAARLARPT